MSKKKAFFISFIVSMAAVFVIYSGMWAVIQNRARETDTPQQGVPKAAPGVNDSKSLLLGLGDKENPYFFVIKTSAISNRIGICCISPQYQFENGTNLAESMKRAGIKQCFMDIEEEFGINIDHYLYCGWQQAAKLCEDTGHIDISVFADNLPPVIKDYLLAGAEKINAQTVINCCEKAAGFLDNEIGLAFMTETMTQIIMANTHRLAGIAQNIKDEYSALNTSFNTTSLAEMERICGFLADSHIEYPRRIILKGDSKAADKIKTAME